MVPKLFSRARSTKNVQVFRKILQYADHTLGITALIEENVLNDIFSLLLQVDDQFILQQELMRGGNTQNSNEEESVRNSDDENSVEENSADENSGDENSNDENSGNESSSGEEEEDPEEEEDDDD